MTEDDLQRLYFLGVHGGLAAYHAALIKSGEEDGPRLQGVLADAKEAFRDLMAEDLFQHALGVVQILKAATKVSDDTAAKAGGR
jgi:hypothetical protein